jgi:tRNA threonylcarbamoyl adenosine modification protein (Sua5/YciO/YrdC/YwlC family)
LSLLYEVDPSRPDDSTAALVAAAEALADGGLVVLPTETVYGIAARPDLGEATERLFLAKQRPRGLSLPVLTGSTEAAWRVSRPDHRAQALANAFWPGPLTLVLPRSDASRPWSLGEAAETVAVRVPRHVLCFALLERAGPLAVTSANRSGQPPLGDARSLVDGFGDAVGVYLVLTPAAASPAGSPSTIVDLVGERAEVTRRGPIPADAIERVLSEA